MTKDAASVIACVGNGTEAWVTSLLRSPAAPLAPSRAREPNGGIAVAPGWPEHPGVLALATPS